VTLLPAEEQKVNRLGHSLNLDFMQRIETEKAAQEFLKYMNEVKACKD